MHNLQTSPAKSSFSKGGPRGSNHPIGTGIYGVYLGILGFLNNCFFFALKAIGIVLLRIFYRIQAENREQIPLQGPLIVAANHFSYMDPIVLQAMFPRRISFMMTELYYKGRGKWFFQLLHCICVKENGSNIAALRKGLEVLKKKSVLGIFPEGGVSREGRLQEGDPGIGFLVVKSGVPVIPVFISGTYEALPKGAKLPKISRIKVIFGRPLVFDNIENRENKKGIVEITRSIMEQIEKLSFSDKQAK